MAAAEVLEDAAPLYASQAETKLRLTKHSREEDIKIARSQILKWQKVLLQVCCIPRSSATALVA